MTRLATVATLIGIFLPVPAFACTCAITAPPGSAAVVRHWSARPAIFVGHALEVDPPSGEGRPRSVRFVTEASWRGALPDTITLMLERASSCALYFAGQRYFVLADIDAEDTTRLAASVCDYAYPLSSPGAVRMQAELGAPAWRAPPTGQRTLDADAIPLGTSLPRDRADSLIAFVVPYADSIARIEIGDFSGIGGPTLGRILYLRPGLYHLGLTLHDGTHYRSYLSVRCEHESSPGHCMILRAFHSLR